MPAAANRRFRVRLQDAEDELKKDEGETVACGTSAEMASPRVSQAAAGLPDPQMSRSDGTAGEPTMRPSEPTSGQDVLASTETFEPSVSGTSVLQKEAGEPTMRASEPTSGQEVPALTERFEPPASSPADGAQDQAAVTGQTEKTEGKAPDLFIGRNSYAVRLCSCIQ